MSRNIIIKALLCLSVVSIIAAYTDNAVADQIVNLPGAENLDIDFNQFSGYLQIPGNDPNINKNMHYWFVESKSDPANDPIAVWTNGGPGCSGLIGFFTEQGPFKPQEDGSLAMNDYAWNERSNVVFIESPCGVGFSYSDNQDDYSNDDAGTATDNYNLIQEFFVRFPDLIKNELYITSESYGGHYMPTLAKEIVDMNTAGNNPILNFKGFAVGNPYTNVYSGTPSGLDTLWGHQMVAKPTYDKYASMCVNAGRNFNLTMCEALMIEMYIEIGQDINHYALDYPVCVADEKAARGRNQRNWFLRHHLDSASNDLKAAVKLEPADSYNPCTDDYATTYLNRADVQSAIHVVGNIDWAECSRSLRYSSTDSSVSMTPIYQYLIDGNYGLKIIVYSGDDDDVCSTLGSQNWVWDTLSSYKIMGRKWESYTVNDQTAGYITKWANSGFSFLTVHGAGHEVPTYKPEAALYIFNSYLDGDLTN